MRTRSARSERRAMPASLTMATKARWKLQYRTRVPAKETKKPLTSAGAELVAKFRVRAQSVHGGAVQRQGARLAKLREVNDDQALGEVDVVAV